MERIPGNSGDERSAGTRAVALEHVDAFNAHDTDRLIAGMHPDTVWATGSAVFRGTSALRDLFDEGFWEMQPSLSVQTLVVDGGTAAAELHEVLVGTNGVREYDIAVFLEVHEGAIRTVKVYREGTADIEA